MCSKARKEARDRLKAEFGQYLHIKRERAQIARLIAELDGTLAAPGTSKWDSMPRGGGAGDPITGGLIRKEQLIERYRRKDEELAAELTRIEAMWEILAPRERELMRYRYVDGKDWVSVCVAIGYEWSQTHRIHNGALDKLIAAGA